MFRREGAVLRERAEADPSTRCWRCGRTLVEHEPHASGKPARWQAGHVDDPELAWRTGAWRVGHTPPWLPEVSTCNTRAGARKGNATRRRLRTTRDW